MPKPKSVQRCETCRRRRIKCDANWPQCTPCVKSGWQCPGPSLDYKFQQYNSSSHSNQATHIHQAPARLKPRIVEEPLASPTELLRADLVQKLESNAMALSLQYLSVAAYMQYIPAMLGSSACLDAAVECICIASKESGQAKLAEASNSWRVGYTRALTLLQSALNDAQESMSSETLATALILKMLELGNNGPSSAASKHSDGLAQLMRHRGPKAFRNDIDFAVIEVESANVACAYYRTGQSCFLADESWDGVYETMINICSPDKGRMPTKDVRLVHVTCQMTMLIDKFRRWSRDVAEGQSLMEPQRSLALYNLATSLKNRLQSWHLDDPYEQSSGLILGLYVSCAVQLVVVYAYIEILSLNLTGHLLAVDWTWRNTLEHVQQSANASQRAIDAFVLFSQKSKWGSNYVANYLRLVWRAGVIECEESLRASETLKACMETGLQDALSLSKRSEFLQSSQRETLG